MLQQEDLLIDKQPQPIKPKVSYMAQLGILFGTVGVGFIVAAIVQVLFMLPLLGGSGLFDKNLDQKIMKLMGDPNNANTMRWMQLTRTFIMFCLPVLVMAAIISKRTFAYLGFNKVFNNKQVLLVLGISLLAMFASMFLGEVSQAIPLTKAMTAKFKAMEEAYSSQVMSIAKMHNIGEYFFVLVVIALCPAIFEELLFRAGLQQLLSNWTKKPVASIILTSLLFSAIHLSFYGFLSRFLLGLVLGFIFHYSKNIWLSILMHFLNNGISITIFYIASKAGLDEKTAMDSNVSTLYGHIAGAIVGLAAVAGLYFLLKNLAKESSLLPVKDTINYLKTDTNPFANEQPMA